MKLKCTPNLTTGIQLKIKNFNNPLKKEYESILHKVPELSYYINDPKKFIEEAKKVLISKKEDSKKNQNKHERDLGDNMNSIIARDQTLLEDKRKELEKLENDVIAVNNKISGGKKHTLKKVFSACCPTGCYTS